MPAENPESNRNHKVAELASPFLSSLSDARSKPTPKSKIAKKCTALLRFHTLASPTRFARLEPFGLVILIGLLMFLPMLGAQLGVDLISGTLAIATRTIINAILYITGNS